MKKLHAFLGATVLGTLSTLPLVAKAGGFQLFEENVTNMGNAYAGTGAEADDASIAWFNPAGMTRLKNPQVVVAGSLIDVNTEAKVKSSTVNVGNLASPPIQVFPNFYAAGSLTAVPVGGESDLHPARSAGIPAFHFVYPFKVDDTPVAFGLSAVVPFGLETNYPETSMVRNLATESAIQTIDIGPSFAIQFLKQFSLGAGIDSQYISATIDQAVPNPAPTILPAFGPTVGGLANEGDSWGLGWHGGVLYQMDDATRFGLAYHSSVDQHISGRATLDTILDQAGLPGDFAGNFNANVTLPGYADLSAYRDINQQWAVLGSVDWTRWSSIQRLTANYTGGVSNVISSASIPLALRDTWRLSAGVDYKPKDNITLRAGTAWDESPVRSANTRTFRLPDSNRVWASLGGQYVLNKQLTFDVGYSHLFVKNSSVNSTQVVSGNVHDVPNPINPNQTVTLLFAALNNATADFTNSSVNEVGAQLTWNIPEA